MAAHFTEQRSGPRYLVHIPIRAEWDDERSGEHVVVEGETENIGPAGALVHLQRLPDVGSRVRLIVASLHYLITPVDLVPDFRAGGYIDDVLVLSWIFGAAVDELDAYQEQPPVTMS